MNKKLIGIMGGAAALVAIIVACIFIFAGGKDEYRSIKVFEIDGTCMVERDGDTLDAFKNMALSSGDTLTVGDGSFTRLKLDDDKYVYLEAGTKISLTATGTANDSKTAVYIECGSMLTEVKKKLSATSSYDIVTPNTTMSIRGTKTLTEVIKDALGKIKTSAAVIEGFVKFQTVQKDKNGKTKFVTNDLSVGQGLSVQTEEKDLVSDADIKSFAETGKTSDGTTVEETSHEELGSDLGAATFSDEFINNAADVLERSAEEDRLEAEANGTEGSSDSGTDGTEGTGSDAGASALAALSVLNDMKESGGAEVPADVSDYVQYVSGTYYGSGYVTDAGDVTNNPVVSEPVQNENDTAGVNGNDPAAAENDDDTFVVDGNDTSLVMVGGDDDAEGDGADAEEDEDTVDGEDGSEGENTGDGEDGSEGENTGDGDDTDDENTGDDDDADNAGTDENDGEDTVEDDNDTEEGETEEERLAREEKERLEKEEAERLEKEEQEKKEREEREAAEEAEREEAERLAREQAEREEAERAAREQEQSGQTPGTSNNQNSNSSSDSTGSQSSSGSETTASEQEGSGTGSGSGSGTDATGTSEGKPVTYTTTRTFASAASQGSASSGDTVSLVFYRGADTISADQLPASYAVDAPLPSENGSGYSVMIDSRHADAYEFVGWYISQELANQADPNNRLITMPASSDASVPLYAGIRKKPVTVIITNMFPAAGRFILPQSNADSEGHLYEQVDNRTIVTGYEYGDVLSLPQEKRFLNNPSEDELLQIPHVEGYLGTDHGMDDVLFVGYSTSADVIVSDLLTDSTPDNYRPEGVTECGMFINRSSDVYLYPGSGEPGVGTTVELDSDILTTDQNGELVLKLYAYFATPITVVTQDCGFASSQGSEFTLGAVFGYLVDDMTVMALAGSGQNAPWARWKVEKYQDVFVMTTWYQGNRTVTIPEFKLLSTDDPNKKVFRLADEKYESIINNGAQSINESFFANRSARMVNFTASVVEYVVIDLRESYDINSFGAKNPYYIKEAGDTTDHLYKVAVLEYKWNNNKNASEHVSKYGLIDCDEYYSYTSPVKQAFGNDGINIRSFVPVPDDAYYPWGLRGQGRTSDLANLNLKNAVGQTALDRNMFVGSQGKKLLGYTISFKYNNEPARFFACYTESVRGKENDYTITLSDKTNTGVSLGSLLSIGINYTFQQTGSGQVTLTPVFGPATALFEMSIVYKQDSTNKYIPYIRIGGIAPEYLGYVSTIDFSADGFGVEYVNVGVNETYRTATLKNLLWNGQAEIRRYMVEGLNDSERCGEMVLDDQTNTYYQDIPFVYIYNDTENTLDPNNRNVFVRGFVRTQNVSDPNPVYIGYYIGEGNNSVACKYVASSYTPCASPDVRIKDESYYQYTGFVSCGRNYTNPVLNRVVEERNAEFEAWQSVKDLQYHTNRWGGRLIGFNAQGTQELSAQQNAKLYGWQGQGATEYVDYTNMCVSVYSAGNIYVTLHGSLDTKRYAGLLVQDGVSAYPYTKVKISNKSDVDCYKTTSSSVTFTESGAISGITSVKMSTITQMSGTGTEHIIYNSDATHNAPDGWMCLAYETQSPYAMYYCWFRVATDPNNPVSGEAVVEFILPSV